jgi:hypothetical protein
MSKIVYPLAFKHSKEVNNQERKDIYIYDSNLNLNVLTGTKTPVVSSGIAVEPTKTFTRVQAEQDDEVTNLKTVVMSKTVTFVRADEDKEDS